jgi:hypothetical protein
MPRKATSKEAPPNKSSPGQSPTLNLGSGLILTPMPRTRGSALLHQSVEQQLVSAVCLRAVLSREADENHPALTQFGNYHGRFPREILFTHQPPAFE